MSNENWIKFEDEMPKLNQEIEVEFFGVDGIFKTKIQHSCTIFYFSENKDYPLPLSQPIQWRYISEKKPDFSKLKESDFISFVLHYHEDTGNDYWDGVEGCGYYHSYNDKIMHVHRLKNGYRTDSFEKKLIKKIFRINLETKEIEKI